MIGTFGHYGLRALQGLLVLSSAASALVSGACRADGVPVSGRDARGLQPDRAAFFVGLLRPQSILLITMPAIWAGILQLARGQRVVSSALLIFLASAMTANSHLFFPLTLAPAAFLWVYPPARSRDWVIGVLAIVLGWLATPYALDWLDVYRHNFGRNLLTRPPSAVTELQPGFVSMLYPTPTPMLAAIALMLALPWALTRAGLVSRERLLAAVYWSVGLILFGFASRLFIAWWLLALPAVGWTIAYLTRSSEEGAPRSSVRLLGLVACLLIIATQLIKTRDMRAMEGDTERRTLPTAAAWPADATRRMARAQRWRRPSREDDEHLRVRELSDLATSASFTIDRQPRDLPGLRHRSRSRRARGGS